MAETQKQAGTTSAEETARAQAARADRAQAEAGKPGAQGNGDEARAESGVTQGSQSGAAAESGAAATRQQQAVARPRVSPEDLFPSLWGTGVGPFGMVSRMFEEMDRLFGEFGFGRSRPMRSGGSPMERGVSRSLWAPQIEVAERDGNLVVCVDLPGLRKEDVKVDLTDDTLTIWGERQEQREGRGYSERTYGSFHRTIPLPEGVSTEGAQARFRDGVLEVVVPMTKQQQERHKQLEIR